MNLFNAKNISKTYASKGFQLQHINFSLASGQIAGVVGENGNGKTTFLRIIAGELSFDEGEVTYFDGQTIDAMGWETIKDKVAYIPQRIPKWYGGLRHNLIFEAAIRGIKGDAANELVDNLVLKLGLQAYIHLKWSEISTGYRLRFQLAKMLIGSPELIVLDEPIANLDINAQGVFLNDLRKIVSDQSRNVSVILSSQQLHEIESIADTVLFLKQGKIIYGGEVENFGKDRTENEFEIQGDFDAAFLSSVFKDIELNLVAKTYNVRVPLAMSSSVFISTILDHNKSITYFRDISSSTRKLFNQ